MESKTENRKWKNAGRFPAELLFMTVFFAGNVLPNLIWKMEWKQKTLASFYLIRSFAGKDISGGAYFLEVLRRRGGFFLLLFLEPIVPACVVVGRACCMPALLSRALVRGMRLHACNRATKLMQFSFNINASVHNFVRLLFPNLVDNASFHR